MRRHIVKTVSNEHGDYRMATVQNSCVATKADRRTAIKESNRVHNSLIPTARYSRIASSLAGSNEVELDDAAGGAADVDASADMADMICS
jgi:hypothetical protein